MKQEELRATGALAAVFAMRLLGLSRTDHPPASKLLTAL